MNQVKSYENNIRKNYSFIFFSNLDLTRGLWMIYIASKGMSLAQLGILEAIFHITSFFMEIPTGMVADIFGRKTSRILGRVFSIVSVLFLILSTNFYLFAISFVLCAISYNLESGAGEALIYDSLKKVFKEEQFIKVSGKIEMIYNISSVVAFVLGGYVATKSYLAAFILTCIFTFMALLQSVFFEEVEIVPNKIQKSPLKIFIDQLKGSINAFIANKKIGFLMIFSEVIGAFSTTMFFYLQNYWKGNGFSEFQIGIIFSLSSILCAVTGVIIYKIEDLLKEKGILLYLPFISLISILGIAYTKYSYVFYILMNIVESIIFVAVSKYINKLIPSENRATILSFRSMIFSFFMIFIFPLVGKLGDIVSLSIAFKVMAIVMVGIVFFNTIIVINIGTRYVKSVEDTNHNENI